MPFQLRDGPGEAKVHASIVNWIDEPESGVDLAFTSMASRWTRSGKPKAERPTWNPQPFDRTQVSRGPQRKPGSLILADEAAPELRTILTFDSTGRSSALT